MQSFTSHKHDSWCLGFARDGSFGKAKSQDAKLYCLLRGSSTGARYYDHDSHSRTLSCTLTQLDPSNMLLLLVQARQYGKEAYFTTSEKMEFTTLGETSQNWLATEQNTIRVLSEFHESTNHQSLAGARNLVCIIRKLP
jgi:hypothetical protein